MSIKDQILTSRPRRSESIEVPEWEATVFVCAMTGAERDGMDSETLRLQQQGKQAVENYRARTLVRTLRDSDGQRIFDDADADKLGEQDSAVLGRLYDVAKRLNGLDVENAEKK